MISPTTLIRFTIPGYKKLIGVLEKFKVPVQILYRPKVTSPHTCFL